VTHLSLSGPAFDIFLTPTFKINPQHALSSGSFRSRHHIFAKSLFIVSFAVTSYVMPMTVCAQATSPSFAMPGASQVHSADDPVPGIPALESPIAIAHGSKATVTQMKGTYIHRWIGSDGEPFIVLSRDRHEYTATAQLQIERDFVQRVQKVHKGMQEMAARVNIPTCERQVCSLQEQLEAARSSLGSSASAMRVQMKDAENQMDDALKRMDDAVKVLDEAKAQVKGRREK
jgi:hypothetical protein